MTIKAPLSYQGGKQKVAKKIVEIIKGDIHNTSYIDLCCGSGAISVELANQGVCPSDITMVDLSDWGLFWEQISNGTFDMCWFEDIISNIPEDKDLIKHHLETIAKGGYACDEYIDVIPTWLVLQAGSFGGKHIWCKDGKFNNASFRNYWKPTETSSRRSPVNPMMPMPVTLLNQVKVIIDVMKPIKAMCCDVLDFDWGLYDKINKKDNVVVFIDPPYEGTTGYGFELDYKNWINNITLPNNYDVYITDYQKHSDVYWVLSSTTKGGISGNTKNKRVEILSKLPINKIAQ